MNTQENEITEDFRDSVKEVIGLLEEVIDTSWIAISTSAVVDCEKSIKHEQMVAVLNRFRFCFDNFDSC
jgi:hypothetical protein